MADRLPRLPSRSGEARPARGQQGARGPEGVKVARFSYSDNDRYLARNEETVLIVRRHVAVLSTPATWALVALVAALLLSPVSGTSWISDILWLVALVFLARLGWAVLEWVNDKIVVTDKRVFELSGVLTRNVASMPLRAMTDLTYQRTLGGRMLGYGTFIVESAGQDQALSRIEYLPEPDKVYRVITGLVFT
jgi:hypothetical protein